MLADVPELLIDVGKGAAIATAVLAAGGALFRLKAVRWLWRTVVSDKLGAWVARTVDGVTAPQFAEVKSNAKAQHDEQNEQLSNIHQEVGALKVAVEDHTQKFVALEQRSVTVTDTHITSTPPEGQQ